MNSNQHTMNSEQNTVIQKSFLEVAKDLTKLAFANAVETIDTGYNRQGAAFQNPNVLTAMIESNQAIYNNLAKEFCDRSAHGANVKNQTRIISDRNDKLEDANQVLQDHNKSLANTNIILQKKAKDYHKAVTAEYKALEDAHAKRKEKAEDYYLACQEYKQELTRAKEKAEEDTNFAMSKYNTLNATKVKLVNENKRLLEQTRELQSEKDECEEYTEKLQGEVTELKLELGRG